MITCFLNWYIDGLVQDFGISSVNKLEIPQSHTKLLISCIWYTFNLVQDCSISSANALEILQSCTKPLISELWVEPLCYFRMLFPVLVACERGWMVWSERRDITRIPPPSLRPRRTFPHPRRPYVLTVWAPWSASTATNPPQAATVMLLATRGKLFINGRNDSCDTCRHNKIFLEELMKEL